MNSGKTSSLSLAALVVNGLVCAILAAAFFSGRTGGTFPALRLAETRLDFIIHFLCNVVFLATLWINTQTRRRLLHFGILLPLLWLVYACLSAASAPIPALALERALYWLDALLLFYVGQTLIALRPDFFLILFACLGNLLGLLLIRTAMQNPSSIPGEYVLAVSVGLAAASVLIVTGREPIHRQRSFLRFLLLILLSIGLGYLVYFFAPYAAGEPESIALNQLFKIRPWIGSGLGAIPEILPSFAAQDFHYLPMPESGWLILRSEVGMVGVGLLLVVLSVPVFRLLGLFHEFNGDGRSFMSIGLAVIILLIAVGNIWHPLLVHPFGQLLLFVILGIASGYGQDEFEFSAMQGTVRRRWEPELAAPLLALVVLTWLTVQESRPYRAARLARKAMHSEKAADLLLDATRIYPLDATLWDSRAAAAREVFHPRVWQEQSEEWFKHIVRLYERSLMLNPYRFKTYWSLATIYELAKRPEPMERTLRRGLSYLPRNQSLRKWLIRSLIAKGDTDQALRELEQMALDLPAAGSQRDPGVLNERVKTNLQIAELYEKQGNLIRAGNHYAMALMEDPTGPLAQKANEAMRRITEKAQEQQEG